MWKLIIVLVVGIAIGFWLNSRRGKSFDVAQGKDENKEKILAAFGTADKVTNDDVQKLLGVSDATATRYLEELEKEGKVRQVGETGKYVHYTLTN